MVDQIKLALPDSLWRATAIEFPDRSALTGDHHTQVVVIGAGFTGCSAALHLAENNIDVIVLDAGQPGIGASGRNGGQVNPGIKRTVEEVQQVWGKDLGAALYKVIGSAPDLVFDLIEKHSIQCHPVRSGLVQPAYSRKSMNYLSNYARYMASIGAPVEILDKQRINQLTGSDFYLGGYIDKRGGSVQPLSYCLGLAKAAMNHGAKIFGDSAVMKIQNHGTHKQVITARGSVNAENVFICTNGYTNLVADDPLIKKLSKTIVPFYSYKVATTPLPEPLQQQIIPELQVIADTRRLLTYFRKDHTGRLVIGSAGGPYEASDIPAYKPIEKRITELYPQLHGAQIEFRWCGKVCLTMDGVPHIHQLEPGIFTGLGYNGRGVALGSLMGKWLASMVSKVDMDDTMIPVTQENTISLHGIRKPFIKTMQYVKQFQDQVERQFL